VREEGNDAHNTVKQANRHAERTEKDR
jgi:hypothetical protein